MQKILMKSIKNARAWLIPILSLALINGCSSVRPVTVDSKPVDRTPLSLAVPDPLSLDFPTWRVVTPENIDQIWKELASKNQSIVLFAVTPEGYEQLIVDLAKIKSLLNEQRVIILEYKKYYEAK